MPETTPGDKATNSEWMKVRIENYAERILKALNDENGKDAPL